MPWWNQVLEGLIGGPSGNSGASPTSSLNPNKEIGAQNQITNSLFRDATSANDAEKYKQQQAMAQYQQMLPQLYDMRRKAMRDRQGLQALSGLF